MNNHIHPRLAGSLGNSTNLLAKLVRRRVVRLTRLGRGMLLLQVILRTIMVSSMQSSETSSSGKLEYIRSLVFNPLPKDLIPRKRHSNDACVLLLVSLLHLNPNRCVTGPPTFLSLVIKSSYGMPCQPDEEPPCDGRYRCHVFSDFRGCSVGDLQYRLSGVFRMTCPSRLIPVAVGAHAGEMKAQVKCVKRADAANILRRQYLSTLSPNDREAYKLEEMQQDKSTTPIYLAKGWLFQGPKDKTPSPAEPQSPPIDTAEAEVAKLEEDLSSINIADWVKSVCQDFPNHDETGDSPRWSDFTSSSHISDS